MAVHLFLLQAADGSLKFAKLRSILVLNVGFVVVILVFQGDDLHVFILEFLISCFEFCVELSNVFLQMDDLSFIFA